MSKGFSEAMGMAIVTFIIVAMIANLGIERVANLDDRIRLNTVPLAAERVETSIYMMNGVDRDASVELNMKGKYNLSRTNKGGIELIFDYDSYLPSEDASKGTVLNPPISDSKYSLSSEGKSQYICIEKTTGSDSSQIILRPEEC